MAQLKDLIVNGASRFIGDIFGNKAQLTTLEAPTSAGGTTYGPGNNGQVLKSNGSTLYWGADNNSGGTVTSVRVQATSPVTSSVNTAQTGTLNTTISLSDGYGDTKNPYASKTKNYVLAAPSTANGVPTFRALVADDIPTLSITDKTSGTLPVNRGGTGATTFTSGALLIGNGTSAVGTRTIKNMTSVADLGWTANATDIYIPTVNTLAYWNGRYNSSSSNLTYCVKGAFGNAVTYGVDDATANGALGTGTGLTTERSVYYGLVTVNNASQTRATGIYAPTSAGTANQILVSAGGTSAPTWKATANGAAYATSANGALTFGTLPVAQGGTGKTSWTAYGIVYASSSSALTNTAAGTDGYILYGKGSSTAPAWGTAKVKVNAVSDPTTNTAQYYVLGADGTGNKEAYYYSGVKIGGKDVLYGAAWNDYAEYRCTKEEIEPGRCVREIGDDTLELTTKRLERGCEIVSDTYGFAIGETNECKTPIAATGRVLVYLYESREEAITHIGWPVCSGPNGTVSIMTEEEEEKYPSRIIGTISAVPDYDTWGEGNVQVNGRVWIRIR